MAKIDRGPVVTLTLGGIEYTKLPLALITEQLAAQGLHVVSADERVQTEKMRIQITEKVRDIGQLCRGVERIARRRTI